jgi:hypothetical protein
MNVTSMCHAPYKRTKARVKRDSSFTEKWPCFANETDLRNTLTAFYDNMTAAPPCTERMGPRGEELRRTARARAEAVQKAGVGGGRSLSTEDRKAIEGVMNAFNFTEDTEAGPYKGRLEAVYWYVPI